MRDVVGAARARRRSGCRRSAGRRARRRSARSARPLAVEAHLVGDGAAAGERLPVADPVRRRARGTPRSSVGADRRVRARRAARATRRTPTCDLYGEPYSSGGPSGSICHHDCPASASQSTNAYASSPSRPDGQRGGCSWTPPSEGVTAGTARSALSARARSRRYGRATECHDADAGVPTAAAAHPHREPVADDRLRPLPRQADGRRRRRGLRRRLARRPRHPARRGRASAARATASWQRAEMRRVDAHVDGDRWAGTFAVTTHRAAGSTRSRRGATTSPPGATSSRARSPPARRTSPSELLEGALLLEQRARRASRTRPTSASSSTRSSSCATTRVPQPPKHAVALDTQLAGASAATPTARGAATLDAAARAHRRPRARALRLLVRALPALVGRLRRASRSSCRASRSSASTSSTCRRSTRSATATARAATTRSIAGPDDPGSPVGDRRREPAATRRSTPSSARSRTSTRSPRRRARARHGHRAGLRDPVQRRPPVADRAPRVVQPPPGRDAEVRREPAQEVPGHLQRQLGLRGLAGPVGGAARRRPLLGRPRRQGLPRRQPAHEAASRSGSG